MVMTFARFADGDAKDPRAGACTVLAKGTRRSANGALLRFIPGTVLTRGGSGDGRGCGGGGGGRDKVGSLAVLLSPRTSGKKSVPSISK